MTKNDRAEGDGGFRPQVPFAKKRRYAHPVRPAVELDRCQEPHKDDPDDPGQQCPGDQNDQHGQQVRQEILYHKKHILQWFEYQI
jgi:hypothetical protein